MHQLDTFEHAGFTVRIYPDDTGVAESPRDWDNVGTFYMRKHRDWSAPDDKRVNGRLVETDNGLPWDVDERLGNAHAYLDSYNVFGWRDRFHIEIDAHRKLGNVVIPVAYRYDGGVTECSDDKADGYLYATRETIAKGWPSWKLLTKARRAEITAVLRAEITTYNQWASGEVYGYVIEDERGEHVDSCWGFYGDDHVTESAKESAEYQRAERDTERAERLAQHAAIHSATVNYWRAALI